MSQISKSLTSGPVPPNVPTTFVADNGTTAIPAANILNLLTNDTVVNNDNGISSTAAGNTFTVLLNNRQTQTTTLTTTDATLTTSQTLALGATPGTFYIYGNIQAFNSTTPASGTYSFTGGYRTDGATATEIGTEFRDQFEDLALAASDVFVSVSGNNVLIQVQGVVGLNINWNSLIEYRRVI